MKIKKSGRRKRTFKIRPMEFMATLIVILNLNPPSVQELAPNLEIIFDIGRVVAFGYMLLLYLFRVHKIDNLTLCVIAWFLSLLMPTLFYSGDYTKLFRIMLNIISAYLFVVVFVCKYRINLRAALYPFLGLLLINLISWIMYPDGMYTTLTALGTFYSSKTWILGAKNGYFPYLLLTLVLVWIIYEESGRKEKRLLCFTGLLCLINILFVSKSGVGIICIIMIIAFPMIRWTKLLSDRKILPVYFMALAAVFVLVVLLQSNSVMSIIAAILNKDITFTGRKEIWQNSIQAILKKPFWGYGVQYLMDEYQTIRYVSTHNRYLYVFLQNGLVGFSVFAGMIYNVVKILWKKYNQCALAPFLGWTLFVIGVSYLAEIYEGSFSIFTIVCLCYYYPQINKINSEETRKRLD